MSRQAHVGTAEHHTRLEAECDQNNCQAVSFVARPHVSPRQNRDSHEYESESEIKKSLYIAMSPKVHKCQIECVRRQEKVLLHDYLLSRGRYQNRVNQVVN